MFVNYPRLKPWACCCPGSVDRDATIGGLTLIANLRGVLIIIRLGSLIPVEGLTHSFPLLTKNMPKEPICPCGQSSLTVLLHVGMPSRFRGGHRMYGMGIHKSSLSSPCQVSVVPALFRYTNLMSALRYTLLLAQYD